jgi:ABC-type antimicrobial peptide transport system permease subunit
MAETWICPTCPCGMEMHTANMFRLSVGGIALGLGGAFILTRAMTTMLVGVAPTDPVTFLVVGFVFFVIAAVSSWLPARRAAALDPATALRGG